MPEFKLSPELSALPCRNSAFMKALRLEKAEHVPVWLMRQAGRYMKEYRDIREGIPFLQFCKSPDLVSEITVKARKLLDADAAIIFSDILVVVEAFGMLLEYEKRNGSAIQITLPEGRDISGLELQDVEGTLDYVRQAVVRTRSELEPEVPLIGFCGAPFTIAAYMIEGGTSRNFRKTKVFMMQYPEAWDALLEKITSALSALLRIQIEAGVQAVQVFDSWVGCLDRETYGVKAAPYSKKLIASVPPEIPVIHFGTGNPNLLKPMADAGGNAIGVDFRIGLDEAWKTVGYDKAVQGNLDPSLLFADKSVIKKKIELILRQTEGRNGFIFNLGHGILPETPFDHARFLVDTVHELTGF